MSANATPLPARPIKRLRIFAGPHGSGKSSIYRAIAAHHNLGVYVNAEDLQIELSTVQGLLLRRFHPALDSGDLQTFYAQHPLRLSFGDTFPFIASSDGRLTLSPSAQTLQKVSDAVTLLADYLRTRLTEASENLAWETALSDTSELAFIRQAKANGYHIDLFYICVASPVISKQRVTIRAKHGGQSVAEAKVVDDYERSLALLKDAVALSDRAYLFDNTYSGAALKLDIRQATEAHAHETQLPEWLVRSLPPLAPLK